MKRMIMNSTDKAPSFEKLAQLVADYFIGVMDEEDFDTFEEMKKTYWWTSSDIKEEVAAVLKDVPNGESYIDEDDGSQVISGNDMMPYKEFSNMWRKIIRAHEKG